MERVGERVLDRDRLAGAGDGVTGCLPGVEAAENIDDVFTASGEKDARGDR
jgi:hypothetical protein